MSFEKAIQALEGLEGGSELAEAIHSKINESVTAEKDKGKSYKKQYDTTDKTLRSLKKALEPLGFEGEADPNEWASEIGKIVKAAKESNKSGKGGDFDITNNVEFKKLQKELKQTAADLETERSTRLQIQQKADRGLIKETMLKSFTKDGQPTHYAVGSIIDNQILAGNVKVKDGKVVFKDPSDDDLTIDYDKGIKNLFEAPEIKEARRNIQIGGGGSEAGTFTGAGLKPGDSGYDEARLKELRKLSKGI